MYVIRNVSKVGLGQRGMQEILRKKKGWYASSPLHSRLVEHGTRKEQMLLKGGRSRVEHLKLKRRGWGRKRNSNSASRF